METFINLALFIFLLYNILIIPFILILRILYYFTITAHLNLIYVETDIHFLLVDQILR